MIYTIGERKLHLPETGPERRVRTPRQVVPYRDMAETCRNLDALCRKISAQRTPQNVVDGIARSGFWGALFLHHWPKTHLVLNEEDVNCRTVLTENFPDAVVMTKSVHQWTPPPSDVSFLDFDHFSLKILDQWRDVLARWAPRSRYFMFVDSACFGFKFGTLKSYGLDKPEDYFYLLDTTLQKITGKRVTAISMFNNAASILMEDKRTGKSIPFLPPTCLSVSRGGRPYKPTTILRTKAIPWEL